MMKKMMQRGFTLIELLVVIAIIGILAATVLAALGTARSSGSDASVKGSVNSMKAQAELYYTTNTNYSNVCTAAGGLSALLTAADSNGYGSGVVVTSGAAQVTGTGATVNCYSTASTWVVSVPLNNPVGRYFCADHTGFSGERTTATGANPAACPAT